MSSTYAANRLIEDIDKFDKYLSNHVRPGTKQLYLQAVTYWAEFVKDAVTKNSKARASNVSSDSRKTGKSDSAHSTASITSNTVKLNGLLNAKTAQAYINMLTNSGKATNTVATRGHAIMRYLKWKGVNSRLDIPTITMKQPEYLTFEQFENVLANCNTPLEEAVITVLFDTAIRINELLNLETKQINYKDGIITVVRKGGRTDEVNISDKALTAIKKWLASRKYSSSKIFNIEYHTVWKLVKKIGKRAGINLHPHMLRHSRARHMLSLGTPPHIVQQHLGHRNISTTLNVYGRFTAGQIKKDIPEW